MKKSDADHSIVSLKCSVDESTEAAEEQLPPLTALSSLWDMDGSQLPQQKL